MSQLWARRAEFLRPGHLRLRRFHLNFDLTTLHRDFRPRQAALCPRLHVHLRQDEEQSILAKDRLIHVRNLHARPGVLHQDPAAIRGRPRVDVRVYTHQRHPRPNGLHLLVFIHRIPRPLSWNVCSEIFPLSIDAQCCAITTCTQWVFQIVVAAITPRLLAAVGWVTYLFYECFCVVSLVWVWACVPETRDVGLARPMDELFGVQKDGEEVREISETSALLPGDRKRRASLEAYT